MRSDYLNTWLQFYRQFPDNHRETIAELVQAKSDLPADIVAAIAQRPDRLLKQVRQSFTAPIELQAINEFVLDHDMPFEIDGIPPSVLKKLGEFGLVNRAAEEDAVAMPAAIASVLSPMVKGIKSSMPTLLGTCTAGEVTAMGARFGISRDTKLETILAISEFFLMPDILESVAERLPDFEYLGGALVAIELGGGCFWQEVFGMDEDDTSSNVVPLMRQSERRMEADIAENLRELGVVFRVDAEPFAMLIVPEELWKPLWELGRSWLSEWCCNSFDLLVDSAVGRLGAATSNLSLRHALKIVALWPEQTVEELGQLDDSVHWVATKELATELSVAAEHERGPADGLLDASRPEFTRSVLSEWVLGYLGRSADAQLAQAFSLDDTWRLRTLQVLTIHNEFAPLWMHGEGVDMETTGGGVLRDPTQGSDDLVLLEAEILFDLVASAKLLFLDMLSLLKPGYWYPKDVVSEFMQMVVSWLTFDRVAQVLSNPGAGIYLPIQRASLISDPMLTEGFDAWLQDVFENFLAPLEVATVDGELVRLETELLRLPNPPGLEDDVRAEVLREILNDPQFEFPMPKAASGFRALPKEDSNPNRLILDTPIVQLREQASGRSLIAIDGDALVTD